MKLMQNQTTKTVNYRYIVGNHFDTASKHESVTTFSHVINEYTDYNRKGLHYWVIGQGISDEESTILKLLAQKSDNIKIVNRVDKRASSKLTHKHKQENILISDPIMCDDKNYTAALLADDTCAELNDHMTGYHLQGMLLLEAARQMMIAVSEKFLIKPSLRGKTYCIWNSININFMNYCFPVDVELRYEVVNVEIKKNDVYVVESVAYFVQNETVCAEIALKSSYYNKEFMEKKESELFHKTVVKSIEDKLVYLKAA